MTVDLLEGYEKKRPGIQVSNRDLIFLEQLGNSSTAEIVKYELADMYGVSIDEIDQLLTKSDHIGDGE